jgi:hypothetical protein
MAWAIYNQTINIHNDSGVWPPAGRIIAVNADPPGQCYIDSSDFAGATWEF